MIYLFQEGWMLDWLNKALSPGMVVVLLVAIWLTVISVRVLGRIGTLETLFSQMKADMVTEASMELAVERMETRLMKWADGRFLTRRECNALMQRSGESDRG